MAELGVFVGNQPSALAQFESWLGRPVDGVLGYTGGSSWGDADPGWQLSSSFLGGTGREILWSIPMYPDGGGVEMLREVAAGTHNGHYTEWAKKILASRSGDSDPIYVRTTWELGGEWFPWTADAKADPAAYRAAFQQFAKSFHDVSDRFDMVWDFNSDRGPVEQWYPGNEAVDVISQDIYWTPEFQGGDPAAAFDKMVNGYSRGLAWMADFAAQHGKPMAISEWSVQGDNAGPFIEAMQKWIASHDVAYATYWNDGPESGYDGRVSEDGRWPSTGEALRGFFGATGSTTGSALAKAATPDTVPAGEPGVAEQVVNTVTEDGGWLL
jgi:Glycosyl hydrolase family 26